METGSYLQNQKRFSFTVHSIRYTRYIVYILNTALLGGDYEKSLREAKIKSIKLSLDPIVRLPTICKGKEKPVKLRRSSRGCTGRICKRSRSSITSEPVLSSKIPWPLSMAKWISWSTLHHISRGCATAEPVRPGNISDKEPATVQLELEQYHYFMV